MLSGKVKVIPSPQHWARLLYRSSVFPRLVVVRCDGFAWMTPIFSSLVIISLSHASDRCDHAFRTSQCFFSSVSPTSATTRSSSASHTVARASLGARQSPRGESEPPEPTLGPLGMADRLNWLIWKKRNRKTRNQCRMVGRS